LIAPFGEESNQVVVTWHRREDLQITGDSGASSNRNDLPGVLEAFLGWPPLVMIRPA